ncbi:von Willebrand factor-like, partial [Diretmus argenteus]
ACGEEKVNDLSLRNGSSTTDQQGFISDWTVAGDGGVCLPRRRAMFLTKCEEQACEESDVCELISAYAHLCRQTGVCVDWRSPHLCPMQCPGSMEYDACRTGCVEDCGSIQALPGDSMVARAPVCGSCEILRERRESKCCPEFECVCDLVSCDLPEVPRCEDGQTVVLKNPGECQPIHECVCKKEECSLQAPPACPAHRRLSIRKTKCCDVFECVCDCQNATQSCPPGFITSSSTNDCGCTETTCRPDKVCVVGGVVYPVGSEWEDACQKCSCTQLQDKHTSLHVAQCTPPVCDQNCPLGSSYTPSPGECCGKCRTTSCVESDGEMRGDTLIGGALRRVGEEWQSPEDKCVLHKCATVNGEVFVSTANVSCSVMDTPTCPLGTELRCDTPDCCPRCFCAPMDACVLNHTVIGGYTLEQEPDACCGRCVPTACILQRPDGHIINLQVNTTREDGCNLYTCGVNVKGDLVLQTRVTTCPPFDRQACLDHGGKVSQIGTSCCEMCMEPECKNTVGTLNYIKVDDCQSEHQIELHYCEGKCRSKSMYSLERAAVEQECVCCAAVETEPLNVPILCTNGTRTHHTVLSVTACDCLSKHCT